MGLMGWLLFRMPDRRPLAAVHQASTLAHGVVGAAPPFLIFNSGPFWFSRDCRLNYIGTFRDVGSWLHEEVHPHHGLPREATSPVAVPNQGTPRCAFAPARNRIQLVK